MSCCQQSAEKIARARTCAGMCFICPGRQDIDGRGFCELRSDWIAPHLGDADWCPLRAWPDADGVVTCGGIRHIGVPMLGRLYIWLVRPGHPRPSRFSSCGCILVLKRAWERLRGL